jgi:hypothetical protein
VARRQLVFGTEHEPRLLAALLHADRRGDDHGGLIIVSFRCWRS